MPPIKELHYLDKLNRTKRIHDPRCCDKRDASFIESMQDLRGRFYLDLESYGRLFQHKGECLSGDISPAYSTLNDEIIDRVVEHFPNLKVVFLARDPVERAWSQLSMGVRLGMINKFDITDPEEVVCNLLPPGVLARSHPSKIVTRWKRYVRPENFRVSSAIDSVPNSKRVRPNLAGAPEAGRHATASRCYCSSGTCWTTASISFSGVTGFADAPTFLLFRPASKNNQA
jgi:hypothetical protein